MNSGKNNRIYLPPLGLRIVKTAIAVAVSVFFSALRPEGMAIYSAIAAVICMQQSDTSSVKAGISRVINTLIAGGFGLVVLLLMQEFPVLRQEPFHALLLGGFIIPIIYVTVLMKRTDSTSMICVVFLAVTFNMGNLPPLLFMWNRMLDTLIGIIVSLLVNGLWWRRARNKDILFITAFDGALARRDSHISTYTKANLNRLIERGAAITVASSRTPATLVPRLKGVHFRLPLIVMNGAAAYHMEKRTYPYYIPIPAEIVRMVIQHCDSRNAQCYQFSMLHGELHAFCAEPVNEYEKNFDPQLQDREFQSYVRGTPPENADCLYLFYAGETEHILALEQSICRLPCAKELHIVRHDSLYHEAFSNMEITSARATKEAAIAWMKREYQFARVAAFGQGAADVGMLRNADIAFCMDDSVAEVRALHVTNIGSHQKDAPVKKINRIFYSAKYQNKEVKRTD